MKKAFIIAGLVGMLVGGRGSLSYATVINGDFSNGLNEWTSLGASLSNGDVKTDNGEAVLGDNDEIDSVLYQGIALAPGSYTLDFDFRNLISNDVPDETSPDTFFASLYFIGDIDQFDPFGELNNGFDDVLDLFNLDFQGVFDNNLDPKPINGAISSSPKGTDWLHFSLVFQNSSNRYGIPTFRLINDNSINDDSDVLIDNVSLNASASPIPEPGTLFLLGSGLLGLFGMKQQVGRRCFR